MAGSAAIGEFPVRGRSWPRARYRARSAAAGSRALEIGAGLSGEYGPAQRLHGYIPDGWGACQGQRPLRKGMQVCIDDDLIIWLTKDLVS
jgi:hypothetical protein